MSQLLGWKGAPPTSLPCFTWEEGGALAAFCDPRPTGASHWPRHGGAELGPSDLRGIRMPYRGWAWGGGWREEEMGVLAACPSGLAPNSCQEHTPCSCPHPHSSRKRSGPSPSLVLGSSPREPGRPDPFPSGHWVRKESPPAGPAARAQTAPITHQGILGQERLFQGALPGHRDAQPGVQAPAAASTWSQAFATTCGATRVRPSLPTAAAACWWA